MKSKRQSGKPTRLTLNKRIASAPTHAGKWEVALHGGSPPTAIQRLVSEAFGLVAPSPHGAEWQAKALAQVKLRFADLLLPALMKDDPRPFEELIQAMAFRRKTEVSGDEFIRRQKQNLTKQPSKKELGRRLRLAILNLQPDDLTSMRTVLRFLDGLQISYSDESHVRRVMRELDVHLLKPGDSVYFGLSEFDLNTGVPKKWQWVRKMLVARNGTVTNRGMSRKEYDDLHGCKAHHVQPAAPDK